MNILLLLYNLFFIPAFYLAFHLFAIFNKKAREGLRARKKQWKYIESIVANWDKNRKIVFIHSASVGEFEQAAVVIEQLKKEYPQTYIVASFFSPSGFNFVKNNKNIDLKIYLPIDTFSNAQKLLKLINPSLFIFSKYDIWANFLFVANKMKIPCLLLSAVLSENSGRIRGIAKIFNKSIYKYFNYIFPISNEDKERFLSIYPYPKRLIIMGNTGADRVVNKAEQVKQQPKIQIFTENKDDYINIIAGSIWQEDEKHILPALIDIYKKIKNIRLILVPHEINEKHIENIEKQLDKNNLQYAKFTEIAKNGTDKDILIVNNVGMLYSLYFQSDIAYIGGSFSTGVHNVMEPAVFANAILFGNIYKNSYEAKQMLKQKSAFAVNSENEAKEILENLINNLEFRKEMGRKNREFMYQNRGATDKFMIFAREMGFI